MATAGPPDGPFGVPAARSLMRRTTIECGPLRIVREYHWTADPGGASVATPPAMQRARRGDWRLIAVAGVLCAVSAGSLAVAATKIATPATYSVSVPLPARPETTSLPARHVARHVPVARARSRADDAPGRPLAAAESAPEETAGLVADRAAAIADALRSGEVQEWHDPRSREHGFVVAGAADRADGRTCRLLSVLTRSSAGVDRVDQLRDCLPAAAGG